MKGEIVIYNGRPIPKEGFRTFVYGPNDAQRLVESWEEYEANIASGVWFSSKEQVIAPLPVVSSAPILEELKPKEEKPLKKRGE
jgi:hypothetical protein